MASDRLGKILTSLESKTKLAARKVGTLLDREIKKKVSGQYLAVATGTLRRSIFFTFSERLKQLVVGVNALHGVAYETGDWSTFRDRVTKQDQRDYARNYRQIAKLRNKRAAWIGPHGKRPFIADTIKEQRNKIERILKESLKI